MPGNKVDEVLGQVGLDSKTLAEALAPHLQKMIGNAIAEALKRVPDSGGNGATITAQALQDAVKAALVEMRVPEQIKAHIDAQRAQNFAPQDKSSSDSTTQIIMKLFGMGGPADSGGNMAAFLSSVKQFSELKGALIDEYKAPFLDGVKYALETVRTSWASGGEPGNLKPLDFASPPADAGTIAQRASERASKK